MRTILSALLLLLFTVTSVWAQAELPRASPKAQVSQTFGLVDITLDYSRPAVKKRIIWGNLVPSGQIWRAGANEATIITFSQDVLVEGQKVPAGEYGLFIYPENNTWTFILNKVSRQWGAYQYDETEDQLRVLLQTTQGPPQEDLSYSFADISENSATLILHWDQLMMPVKIEKDSDATYPADVEVQASPAATVSQRIGISDITINYHRPSVNNRTIWGELVPLNEIWRTGANNATTIEFNTDVVFAGKLVPAGRYAIFTIPTNNEWTIILNNEPDQWGAFGYKSEKDQIQITTTPKTTFKQEQLLISFADLHTNSTELIIHWDSLAISVPITVDVQGSVIASAQLALRNEADADVMNLYADYCLTNEINFEEALTWSNYAASFSKTFRILSTQAKLLANINDFEGAVATGTEAIKLTSEMESAPRNLEAFQALLQLWTDKL